MFRILVYLEIIRISAKQLHYHLTGDNFYGDHLLMDRVQDKMIKYIDSIKENYYLARNKEVPHERKIYEKVVSLLPDDITMELLREYITKELNFIDEFLLDETDAAVSDLLGTISSNLSNSLGLLNNRLKNTNI